MLAPSAITLRRPSGEADLILARMEGGISCYNSMTSPAFSSCDSVHSAPPDAFRGPAMKSGSINCSQECSRASSPSSVFGCETGSPLTSPEVRRRRWHRKLLAMKQEVDKIGKNASASIRGSFDSLLSKLSSKPKKIIHQVPGLTIEIVREPTVRLGARKKHRNRDRDNNHDGRRRDRYSIEDDSDLSFDVPDRNFSNSLQLTSLHDGQFNAEIAMEKIPSGHVSIRVCEYNLELTVIRRDFGDKTLDDDHRISRPYYLGNINIPIYVNPSTLQFQLDEEDRVLRMSGKMKGCSNMIPRDGTCSSQRMCLSATDLRQPNCNLERGIKVPLFHEA